MVHICKALNVKFIPRVRWAGHRKYELLGKPCKTEAAAIHRLTKAMATKRYKRGDVLMLADWYDPLITIEIVRSPCLN